MSNPNDPIMKTLGLVPDTSSQSAPVRKKTALQRALDELVSLPREEMLRRVDARQAGANLERFFACDKNKDCHNHSEEVSERVSRAVGDYRRFDEGRRSFAVPDSGVQRPSQQGRDIFEISGSIKWFDVSKGYGFVVPDDGSPDILLHVTCLRAGGYQTAYEGTRICCEVLRRPKGPQVVKIISMDENTAIHTSLLSQRTHVLVTPDSDWELMTVKWFNRVRGFGFLSRGEETETIFLHMETLRRFGFTEVRPGQLLEVRWGIGSKGVTAAELRPAPGHDVRQN